MLMVLAALAKWVVTTLIVEDQVYKTLELVEGTKGNEV